MIASVHYRCNVLNGTKPLGAAERDLRVLAPPDAALPGTGGYMFTPIGATIAGVFTLLALAGTLVMWRLRLGERT